MNDDYWNNVVANLGDQDTIQFGITGNGTSPNYQIIKKDGKIRTFSGLNHESHSENEFNPSNLTDSYVLADINNPRIREQIYNQISSWSENKRGQALINF